MVKDADGKRISDLKKEDFEIYEDGVLQEIADFKPAPHPLRLILLFDTSVSMEGDLPRGQRRDREVGRKLESTGRDNDRLFRRGLVERRLGRQGAGHDRDSRLEIDIESPASATASPANASRPSTGLPGLSRLLAARFLTAGCLTRTRISLERCAPSLIGLEAGAETRSFLSSATARIPSIAILRSRAGQRPKQVISEAQENLSQICHPSSNQIRRVQGSLRDWERRLWLSCKFLSEIAGAGGERFSSSNRNPLLLKS